ncbi:MAG: HNH endonuclease [Gammaproteobacteria bacterium]|nr:HNH endonuclease [Gammaproteobacteria bacterium]
MSLFHYQKITHKRKLSPGPFKNYRTYKKYLKIEFDATCVYCRMPDSLSEEKSYAVEHYRPKSKFPHLETAYSNLFYSCCNCNGYKGSFWPDNSQKAMGMFVPNPCDHVMHDHLRSQAEGTIKPHSLTGQWAIELLDLNAPLQVKKRLTYLKFKKTIESQIADLKGTYSELEKNEKKIVDSKKLKSLQQDMADVERQILEYEDAIKIFGS